MKQLTLDDIFPGVVEPPKQQIKSTDWKWKLKDGYPEPNGLKVFSCFACGGGSTMGYKLSGCSVLGCCEIDKRMNEVYVKNHHPKYNYLMDIREFNKLDDLPPPLYNLDILDGSPPCTPFSMVGKREETWGKKKKFAEGQAEQVLDDLPFVFIDTVAKLQPKVVIMENVPGILQGAAYEYVRKIYAKFKAIGYTCRHVLLDGSKMGVPQTRKRVFFIATRLKFDLDTIDFNFNYEPIPYKVFKTYPEKEARGKMADAMHQRKPTEKVNETMLRIYGKRTGLTQVIAYNNKVFPTVTAGHLSEWTESGNHPSDEDYIHTSTFPEDFDFCGKNVSYICGMSVPPIMIKRIVTRLRMSGIFEAKPK